MVALHSRCARTMHQLRDMQRIRDVMTSLPWTVQVDDSLAVARRMLAEREIRHLPVLDGAAVIGMVNDRDVALAGDRLGTVADALMPVHQVAADTPFGDVLDQMTVNHWDAVVVTDDGRVEGIFTATDGLRVLADFVRRTA
jgi:acetoin utilization protein AcuB